MARPIDIIVPFYRNPGLVSGVFGSLTDTAEELRSLSCAVIAVNDSPEDGELRNALREHAPGGVPYKLIENPRNLGFVASVNTAMRASVQHGNDVVLLNSDTQAAPGAIAEMRRVAYLDSMIGFVSPRSNNASICSFPHQKRFRNLPRAEAFEVFEKLAPRLPEFHFAPTAVGFALFIKFAVLDEFGLFDECYSPGYHEENDLIMRANRRGYRAALANRAWAYHAGEVSFGSSGPARERQQKNAAILDGRYPEYRAAVRRYVEGPHYAAERLMAGLVPDAEGRLDLLFDVPAANACDKETIAAAKQILSRAGRLWRRFNVFASAPEEARRFHKLDEIEGIRFAPPDEEKTFAIGFRFGQPDLPEHLSAMSDRAAANVYAMLDPTPFDYLNLHSAELEVLWDAVFRYADGVVYTTNFAAEAFGRRFERRPSLREITIPHSPESTVCDWDRATAEIGEFLENAADSVDFENVLVPRLRHLRLLRKTNGDARVKEIHASWSWRITAPLREVYSLYLKIKPKS